MAETKAIPVYLGMPGKHADPFADLIGLARIGEYGTLVITIPPDELTERVEHLAQLDQIVGVIVDLQYRFVKEKDA